MILQIDITQVKHQMKWNKLASVGKWRGGRWSENTDKSDKRGMCDDEVAEEAVSAGSVDSLYHKQAARVWRNALAAAVAPVTSQSRHSRSGGTRWSLPLSDRTSQVRKTRPLTL